MENSRGSETMNWGRTEQEESEGNHSEEKSQKEFPNFDFPTVYMLKEESRKYLMENKDRSKCEI